MPSSLVKRSGIYLLLEQQKIEAKVKISTFLYSHIKTQWIYSPFY